MSKAGKMRALGQTSRDALGRRARYPDHRRVRPAGLRGRDLLRHLPAGRRAAGPGRASARRRRRDGPLARGREEIHRPRAPTRSSARPRSSRLTSPTTGEMGPPRQGGGPQGRVTRAQTCALVILSARRILTSERCFASLSMTASLSLDRREGGRRQQLVGDVGHDRRRPSRSRRAWRCHSGSAWKAFHFFSRSASDSQASR